MSSHLLLRWALPFTVSSTAQIMSTLRTVFHSAYVPQCRSTRCDVRVRDNETITNLFSLWEELYGVHKPDPVLYSKSFIAVSIQGEITNMLSRFHQTPKLSLIFRTAVHPLPSDCKPSRRLREVEPR